MSDKRLPYFPVWLDDLFGSHAVRMLGQDPALLGGYLLLLFAQWSAPEQSLPADERELRNLAWLSPSAWKRLWGVVGPAFVPRADGRLQHARVEQERLRATGLSEKRSASGKRGAAARWQTDGKRNGKQHGKRMPSRVGPGYGSGSSLSYVELGEDVAARGRQPVDVDDRDAAPDARGERDAEATIRANGHAPRRVAREGTDETGDTAPPSDRATGAPSGLPDVDDQALATRMCALIRESGVRPKHRASPSSGDVAAIGKLVRRLVRDGSSLVEARDRIRAAMAGVYQDSDPDDRGFSWARQLLSGDAWAGKTRSGEAYKFDLVEAHLAQRRNGTARDPRRGAAVPSQEFHDGPVRL